MINQPLNVNFEGRPQVNKFPTDLKSPQEKAPEQNNLPVEKDSKLIVKILDKIIGFCISMLFFGTPLYFTNLASQGIIFEKQIYFYFWILLGLVVWASKSVISGDMKIKRTPLDFPILGFWLVCAVSTFFSVDRWRSFAGAFGDPSRSFMAITSYIIAYYFILSNFNFKRLKLILVAILSSGAIMLIWTALAILGIKFLPDSLSQYAPLSLAGSVSSLGMIIASLVPLFVLVILKLADASEMSKIKKNFSLSVLAVFLALDLFLILALYNYIPWAGFFIGISIFLIFILAKIARPVVNWTWLPMAVFVLAMILRMTTGDVSIARIKIPADLGLSYGASLEIAKESAKNKLWIGSGPATYNYDFSLYRPKDFNLNAFYNLRFFQGAGFLSEAIPTIGIIGTIFFAILILSYIGSQFYLLYRNKEKNKLYSLGIFSSSAIILTGLLSAKTDGTVFMMAFLFIALSLAVLLFESENYENNFSLSLKASPKFALALAFIFMVISAGVAFLFVFIGKIYAADINAGKAAMSIAKDGKNINQAIDYLGKAANLNRYESKYYSQLSQYYMVMANNEIMKGETSRDINSIKQYLNYSVAAASKSKDMSPNDVAAEEMLALIYENASLYVADYLKPAEESYNQALKLEPHNPVFEVKLGRIKISMAGQEKDAEKKKQLVGEAESLFQKSIDEKNNYAEGYYQLSLAQSVLDKTDQAIENGTKAVQLDSKNADYFLFLGGMFQKRNKGNDMKSAEQCFKQAVALNNENANAHFYLGVFYEKNNQKDEAKNEYNKVKDILGKNDNNKDTVSQIQKMIDNIDKGIENTPESLGLTQNNNQPPQPADNSVPETEQIQE